MNSSELQRPIGFIPSQVSALINKPVVEQHAEEAAFLWTMRNRAVDSPNYTLKDLQRLDERVEAHLDGLRAAGNFGRVLCQRLLNDRKEVGEVFAGALLAFDASDADLIDEVLVYSKVPALARGIVSALGWLPFNSVENRIREFLGSTRPESQRIGVAGSAVHRVVPGRLLREAIEDDNPFLQARALRAVGELGGIELLPKLRSGFTNPDERVRFAAAWSATRLSENVDSLGVLRTIAESTTPCSEEAIQIAIRRMDLTAGKSWQASLVKRQKLRMAVIAAGAIGDPLLVPWIIEQMNVPALARVAGQAFSMITGADLAYEDLDADKPEGFEVRPNEKPEDEEVTMDTDENLRWPANALVSEWWSKHQAKFHSGKRYLRGKEITVDSLRHVLFNGTQKERKAAALELALRDPTQPLFEVRARAQLQLDQLKRWT